jgi:hypothetical protein
LIQTLPKKIGAENSRPRVSLARLTTAISDLANPFKEKSSNENVNYANDAPDEECPNPSEMAVRGIAEIPTPGHFDVGRNAIGREAPSEHDEPQN